MAFHGNNNDFGVENFPNLYPENLQDAVNESYTHDKVLPRIEGQDYNDKITNPAHETDPETTGEGTKLSGETY